MLAANASPMVVGGAVMNQAAVRIPRVLAPNVMDMEAAGAVTSWAATR